jgi:hypothetical protein
LKKWERSGNIVMMLSAYILDGRCLQVGQESWVSIFENTKKIKFFITNVKVKAFEKIAIVVCLENIDSDMENKNIARTGVIATNIFEKQHVNNNKYNNEWLMVHHHGSSVANYMPPNVTV